MQTDVVDGIVGDNCPPATISTQWFQYKCNYTRSDDEKLQYGSKQKQARLINSLTLKTQLPKLFNNKVGASTKNERKTFLSHANVLHGLRYSHQRRAINFYVSLSPHSILSKVYKLFHDYSLSQMELVPYRRIYYLESEQITREKAARRPVFILDKQERSKQL